MQTWYWLLSMKFLHLRNDGYRNTPTRVQCYLPFVWSQRIMRLVLTCRVNQLALDCNILQLLVCYVLQLEAGFSFFSNSPLHTVLNWRIFLEWFVIFKKFLKAKWFVYAFHFPIANTRGSPFSTVLHLMMWLHPVRLQRAKKFSGKTLAMASC